MLIFIPIIGLFIKSIPDIAKKIDQATGVLYILMMYTLFGGIYCAILKASGLASFRSLTWIYMIPVLTYSGHLLSATLLNKENKKILFNKWTRILICTGFYCLCVINRKDGFIYDAPSEPVKSYFTFGVISFLLLIFLAIWLFGEWFCSGRTVLAAQIHAFILALTPFLMFLICENASNPNVRNISLYNVLINVLLCFIIEIVVINLFRTDINGLRILFIASLIVGISNHFVMQFRNNPIMAVDAMEVWVS